MILYKYASLNTGIEIIKKERILLNNPIKFNDPYDCYFGINDEDFSKHIYKLSKYTILKNIAKEKDFNKYKMNSFKKKICLSIKREFEMQKEKMKTKKYFDGSPLSSALYKNFLKCFPKAKEFVNEQIKEYRKKLERKILDIRDKSLISCFSMVNDSVLMWSHYADSHRGVCFEIEYLGDDMREVEYTNKLPSLKLENFVSVYLAYDLLEEKMNISDFEFKDDFLAPFFIKSTEWDYEREVRCVFSPNNLNGEKVLYEDEKYYLINGKIKTVFIGCNASGYQVDNIIEYARNRNIKVVFMKKSNQESKIIPDNNHMHIKSDIVKEENNILLKIIAEIENSLDKELYIAALVLALNIPMICGLKEFPNARKRQQYINWANEWIIDKNINGKIKNDLFISSDLLYKLKKKFDDKGTFDIKGKFEYFTLDKFYLRIENEKNFFHIYQDKFDTIKTNDKKERIIGLNIRGLCKKIINSAKQFYSENNNLFNDKDNVRIENYDKIKEDYIENQYIKKGEKFYKNNRKYEELIKCQK